MKKLTPIIVVDAIEPCLGFWTDRLGFEVTVTVPHEEHIGFAILAKDNVEIMYQSRASVAADVPAVEEHVGGAPVLFIEVEDVDAVERALGGAEVLVPRRQTFYGMDEIFVRAPCGTVVGFAAPVGKVAETR
jgi:uncharacterized glyoxalase superfamily protein PhnB